MKSAIVIGGGFAGLSAATALGGKRVCVTCWKGAKSWAAALIPSSILYRGLRRQWPASVHGVLSTKRSNSYTGSAALIA